MLIYLVRHGGTAWSVTRQHTGRTDIPLTAEGEAEARCLADRLRDISFVHVYVSPLQRAVRTCELAGFRSVASLDDDLMEWNYGDLDGLTSQQIRERIPGWELFRNGCPKGESITDVSSRADRVIERLRTLQGNVLVFSHGHFLRVLGARWMGMEATAGRHLLLDTTAVSIVGTEHGATDPVIRLWNDCHHLQSHP